MPTSLNPNKALPVLCDFSRGWLRTADIILTASQTANSKVIQMLTCAPVSHGLIMVSPITSMDAMPFQGLKRRDIGAVLSESGTALVLRHRGITPNQAKLVAEYVESQVGKKYDYFGAVRSAVETGCKRAGRHQLAYKLQVLDEYGKLSQENHGSTFFCSELIVRAFEVVGLPLSKYKARGASPGAILKADSLAVMGRLV